MTISSRPDSFELADYLGVLRRRWLIVLVLSCVGVLLAGAYAKLAPRTYTASVSVYVSSAISTGNPSVGRTTGLVNMDNEAQIVQSTTVAAMAGRALHSPLSTAALLKQVSVAVPPNTTVLQINCSAPKRAAAALCANDFGAAFLRNRLDTAEASVSSEIASLRNASATLSRRVADLRARLKALPPGSPDQYTDQLDLNAAVGQLTEVEDGLNADLPQLASMQQPGNTLAGYVTTPATPPSTPSSPRKLLLLPSGLLGGLLIGLLLAFVVDRRDQRIHSTREIERYLDLPVLLDAVQKRSSLYSVLAVPRSRAGRAFTELAQYVAASLGDEGRVLLVAGTSGRADGSVVAANLAATLARTRSEVALICADLSGTITPQLLGVGDGRGLAEVLAGSATVSEVARRPAEASRLRVITPGLDISGALLYLQHEASRRLVADLCRDARYVIIEAQSVGQDADAFAFSEFTDAALLAVEVGGTSRLNALDCIHRLDRLHIPVLGATVLPVQGARQKARPRSQPPPRPAAPPRVPARSRVLDQADEVLDTPKPWSAKDATADQDNLIASRGPGETWPLPRAAMPPPEAIRRRVEHQDPPDKVAGV
jgi:capsular polysaccharide biosynthesis protein